jgi:hypothetical protein
MGEAKRRRLKGTAALQSWLAQARQRGQGVFRLELIRAEQAEAIMEAAESGDVEAMNLVLFIHAFLDKVETSPVLCQLCKVVLSAPPAMITRLVTNDDTPDSAVVSGICRDCTNRPDLKAAIDNDYQSRSRLELHKLSPPSEAGRA